jgi:hypothetical protein
LRERRGHGAERRRILGLDVRKYHAMDKRSLGAGSLRSTSCLQTVLSPSGSTSGGNATRRRVARKRWSERTCRAVSLRAASAAGRARAAAIATGQTCSWQRGSFSEADNDLDSPSNRGTPEAKVRLDPLGAFGGARLPVRFGASKRALNYRVPCPLIKRALPRGAFFDPIPRLEAPEALYSPAKPASFFYWRAPPG